MRSTDDGGGGDPTRDALLQKIVEDLGLDQHPELSKPGSKDRRAALLEDQDRNVVLWAQIRPFSIGYAAAFPQANVTDQDILTALEEAVDEPIFFLTNAILKRHLRGEKPYNLSSLAEVRFAKNSRKWERWKGHLTDISFVRMSDHLRLWKVTVLEREESRGGNIAGYVIEAGQALIDFHDHVYHRQRMEMMRAFYVKYLSDGQKKG